MGAGSDAHVLQGVGTGALHARVRRRGGVPAEPAVSARSCAVRRRSVPPGAEVGGAGQERVRLGEKRRGAPCPLPDRRDLRAVPAEGHHRDRTARRRGRATPRRRARSRARLGHPLADVLLRQVRAAPSEVQEGVAFFGRAGQAILKSLAAAAGRPDGGLRHQLPQVRGPDEDEGAPWLLRELHIVQPKLVVVMGEDALGFVNGARVPALRPGRGPARLAAAVHGRPSRPSYVPDIDASLDEQAAKTRFWNAFKPVGTWWAELPPY